MINQMNFLGLVVKDVKASTQYYTEKLGLKVNKKESIPDFYTQFELNGNGGGAIFALVGGFEQEGIEQSFDTALAVSDVDATYAQLEKAGVDTLSEPRDMPFGRTFLFRTPDGHVLRIFSPPSNK